MTEESSILTDTIVMSNDGLEILLASIASHHLSGGRARDPGPYDNVYFAPVERRGDIYFISYDPPDSDKSIAMGEFHKEGDHYEGRFMTPERSCREFPEYLDEVRGVFNYMMDDIKRLNKELPYEPKQEIVVNEPSKNFLAFLCNLGRRAVHRVLYAGKQKAL